MTTPTTNSQEQEAKQELPLADNRYGEVVRSLVENGSHFNENQLSHMISENIVKDIVQGAEEGRYFSQRKNETTGDIETKIYTPEDLISHQIEVALEAQDTQPDKPSAWAVNIPRSDGLRDALIMVMKDPRLANPFRLAIYREQAELMRKKDMTEFTEQTSSQSEIITGVPEALTEEREQFLEEVREDLAEEALDDMVVDPADITAGAEAARRTMAINAQEVQKDPYDYLRTALPPVVRPQNSMSGAQGSQESTFGQYEPTDKTADKQKYYDKFVTLENRENALETLAEAIKATPEIQEVLERYDISNDSLDAVDAIRENPDVRFEVAKILTQKLDQLAAEPSNDMGWRINQNSRNNLKTDAQTAEKMLSRTYAVSMALKMIGGEFSTRLEGKNDFQRDEDGNVAMGQHRHAATSTLMTRI